MSGSTDDGDVEWLTAQQIWEWKSCMTMLTALPTAMDAQLKRDAGLNTFEYHVLVSLAATRTHSLPMGELATLARGSASRLSHAVERLERAGWVRRRSSTEAGRRTEALLTEAGFAKLGEAAPGHVREVRRLVIDVLTPEQLAALGEAARAITRVADATLADALERDPST